MKLALTVAPFSSKLARLRTFSELVTVGLLAIASASAKDLAAYVRADHVSSVVYTGTDRHLYELYIPAGSTTPKVGEPNSGVCSFGGLAAYVRSDHISAVVYKACDSHVHELSLSGGSWHDADLTSIAGGPKPASDLAAYVRSDGFNSVVYLGGDGHIHELYLSPRVQVDGDHRTWSDADLSAQAHAQGYYPPNGEMDPSSHSLAAFSRSDGVNSVVYIGLDAHIHELSLSPGGKAWQHGDLSTLAHAAHAATYPAPAAYVRSDHVNSVLYSGALDGHLHELYLIPGSTWQDGTIPTLGSVADGVTPAPYVRSDGVNSVIYFGSTDADVHELSLTPGGSAWQDGDLSTLAHVAGLGGGPLAGYVRSDGVNSVVYVGLFDYHVHEFYLAGKQWQVRDLSALTHAVAASLL